MRRIITHRAEAGGEVFETVDVATFQSLRDTWAFALSCPAHETHYRIPATIDGDLSEGHDLVAKIKALEIDNSGPLNTTVTAILAYLYPVNA